MSRGDQTLGWGSFWGKTLVLCVQKTSATFCQKTGLGLTIHYNHSQMEEQAIESLARWVVCVEPPEILRSAARNAGRGTAGAFA